MFSTCAPLCSLLGNAPNKITIYIMWNLELQHHQTKFIDNHTLIDLPILFICPPSVASITIRACSKARGLFHPFSKTHANMLLPTMLPSHSAAPQLPLVACCSHHHSACLQDSDVARGLTTSPFFRRDWPHIFACFGDLGTLKPHSQQVGYQVHKSVLDGGRLYGNCT